MCCRTLAARRVLSISALTRITRTVTHYDKAPITEALIDLRFNGPELTPAELAELQEREAAAYPDKRPLYFAPIAIGDAEPGEPPAFSGQSSTQRGWAFVTADKLQVWQARTDGFTFSRLAPYQSWDPFRDEARRLWNLCRTKLKPEAVTRVAVRYINRLELPLPLQDFKDYLRTVPEVSPMLPQGISTFFMQLHIPYTDINSVLILNQQLVPPCQPKPDAPTASILLDIDLFRTHDLPQAEEPLWNIFEELHSKKNEVFEGCITDRTRELIK